jgi:hypothetical protein
MTDLDALEKLAREASRVAPGGWHFSPWHIEEGQPVVRHEAGWILATTSNDADAAFIAAANPATILSLISALRSRDAEVAGLRMALERLAKGAPPFTEAPRRPGSFACTSCNDTGMIAIRSRDGAYAFPGPVPDDARGYADADCWHCDCGRKP